MKTLQLAQRNHCSRVCVLDAHYARRRLVHVVGQHGVLLCVQDSQISSIERADGLDHGAIDKRCTTRLPVNDVCIIYRSVSKTICWMGFMNCVSA